jgi:hypothetical protein
MSSRLIILPKKSYCPWKPENVERVLRDEAKHREVQESTAAQSRRDGSRHRVKALKEGKRSTSPSSQKSLFTAKHVNLFEVEENEHKKTTQNFSSGRQSRGTTSKGVHPVYLTPPGGESTTSVPFYLRDKPYEALTSIKPAGRDRQEEMKSRLDPMDGIAVHSPHPNKYNHPKHCEDHVRSVVDAKSRKTTDDYFSRRKKLSPPAMKNHHDHHSKKRTREKRMASDETHSARSRTKSRRRSSPEPRESLTLLKEGSLEALREKRLIREENERRRQVTNIFAGDKVRRAEYNNRYK